MTKEYITFGDNGKGRVLSMATVKVSESVTLIRVSLAKSLGYNLLSVSQLLVVFKSVSKRVVLMFWILEAILCVGSSSKVKFSELIFSLCIGSSRCLVLVFRRSFGNGIGD
jgi:ABC-type multidrug transport system fused ATPase/permease subunit